MVTELPYKSKSLKLKIPNFSKAIQVREQMEFIKSSHIDFLEKCKSPEFAKVYMTKNKLWLKQNLHSIFTPYNIKVKVDGFIESFSRISKKKSNIKHKENLFYVPS